MKVLNDLCLSGPSPHSRGVDMLSCCCSWDKILRRRSQKGLKSFTLRVHYR